MISHAIKIFLSVAEKGNITEVANSLFISQPAISKTIKALEQKLSLKLFHRDKRRGLILTDAGEKILLLARQMANLEDRIYQTAFEENNCLGGKVRVACVPIATTLILSKALREYRQKYPAVTIEIKEGTPTEIQELLENYTADFAITYAPFGIFDSEVLLEDEMVGIACEENLIELHDGVADFIFCRSGWQIVRKNFDINADKNLVVQNAQTVVKLVEEGLGVGILSKLVLSTLNGQVKICQLKPSIKTQVGLIAHDLKDLSPIALALICIIKKVTEKSS